MESDKTPIPNYINAAWEDYLYVVMKGKYESLRKEIMFKIGKCSDRYPINSK